MAVTFYSKMYFLEANQALEDWFNDLFNEIKEKNNSFQDIENLSIFQEKRKEYKTGIEFIETEVELRR